MAVALGLMVAGQRPAVVIQTPAFSNPATRCGALCSTRAFPSS